MATYSEMTESAVEKNGVDTPLLQLHHLVLHKRNQRRYDNGYAIEDKSRQLVAERLSTALLVEQSTHRAC